MKRAILVVAVLAAVLVPAGTAHAIPACSGNAGNHFIGKQWDTSTDWRGAEITITHGGVTSAH